MHSVKVTGQFLGDLAMKMTHAPSGASIKTDPPLDNGGGGQDFSPTDLVATGLGACVMSVMAIYAKREGLDLTGMTCEVEKYMSETQPRRIGRLDLVISLPASLTPKYREILERVGKTCPVVQSLHPDIMVQKTYRYQ